MHKIKNFRQTLLILLILVIGSLIRIFLANTTYNFDIENFIKDIQFFDKGVRNIYAVQKYYNYSPIFFYILAVIGTIQKNIVPYLSLAFCIRLFISLIDLFSTIVLIKIAKLRKINILKTLYLFYLNPVSIIISAKHGQFDNLVILLLLISIYFILQYKIKRNTFLLIWFLATLAIIIKHIIIFQSLIIISKLTNKILNKVFLFSLSISLFLLTFVPFWKEGNTNIVINVFKYGGIARSYGFTSLLNKVCGYCEFHSISLIYVYKYIFILISLCFTWLLIYIKKDVIWSILISILFFLTFASGIGGQYFVLPIAIGSLKPSKLFYIYSIVTTLFLLGNNAEFDFKVLNIISWNFVWIIVAVWFINEFKIVKNNFNYIKIISYKILNIKD